jgi:single-stranded-DNA-specific exonuclease
MRWIYKETPSQAAQEELSKQIQISKIPAQILLQRNISDFDTAKEFFRPSLEDLHNPFLMKGMTKAVSRLEEALQNNEKLLIYGDYDVDGTTSVALVYSFLKNLGVDLIYYIPDRHKEGYGVSMQSIEFAKEQKIDLIISLDCGVTAIEEVELANSFGIDFIICDHHLPKNTEIPDAYAMLNPKQHDCKYPFDELSGCGIGFKFMQGLSLKLKLKIENLYQYLDLLMVSIASDIVPMYGENRILAYYGLQQINTKPSLGLKALIQIAGFTTSINIGNVVFGIAPRINAAGRLGSAYDSLRLLIATDENEVQNLAFKLNNFNEERKKIERASTEEALAMAQKEFPTTKSLVLYQENWHKGLVGIMAARCVEKFHRPAIILCESNGKAVGSARSVSNFNVYKAIESSAEHLIQFGGHAFAAGMSLEVENIAKFRTTFEKSVRQQMPKEGFIPQIKIDLKVKFEDFTAGSFKIIQQMSPFGPHNMQPIFASEGVYLDGNVRVLKERHLKFKVRQGKKVFDAIAFGMVESKDILSSQKPFKIAFVMKENNFRGRKTLQLEVRDILPMEI